MFNNKKKKPEGVPAKQAGTYIAMGSTLEGDFRFSGPCVIACEIKGNVTSTDMIVLERSAIIHGDINGANVIIHGKVQGEVLAAESLELGETAEVEGRISSPQLKVSEGAQCRASMEISRGADAVPALGHTASNVTPIDQAPAANANHRDEPISQPVRRTQGFLTAKI